VNRPENNVRVVLVSPRNPLNIGAAARAMLNFGFSDLAVVAPHEPVWREAKSAVGAESVLMRAHVTTDLADSVADRTLVIGTSSLERRQLRQGIVPLNQLADRVKDVWSSRIAIVFGSEKKGLTNDDLSHCHFITRIPTTDECPSMNLGQAVAVCCYELRRVMDTGDAQTADRREPQRSQPLGQNQAGAASSAEDIQLLLDTIERMRGAESPVQHPKSARLRNALLRWQLTRGDVSILMSILRDIEWRMKSGE
jgi:TrmH family RNA methyltransferase